MFRKITKNDKDIFLKMCKEFYESEAVLHKVDEKNHENTFDELMRSDDYIDCYIFEYDDKVMGYGLVAKTFSPEAGGICIWIEEILVKQNARGKGIGTKFLSFVKENFGATRIRLEVEKDNQKAKELYKREGFEILEYEQMYQEF